MFASKVFSRVPRRLVPRSSLLLRSVPQKQQSTILSDQFRFHLCESPTVLLSTQVYFLHHSAPKHSIFQRFGVSSSTDPEPTGKEKVNVVENNGASRNAEATNTSGDAKHSNQTEDSDSENEEELSVDDLIKLVAEKEELLKLKHKEIEVMQDKVLRTYAEMENVMNRTRQEAKNSKKFAIQSFVKSLLDVADNLERASLEVTKSFAKLDTSTDSAGALPLLKTLLEGVEMTEKQLLEVFKKYGVEKFDPTNQPFDPHRHNAVFQIPDGSKPSGTVAVVLKSGYLLYDRVVRPAEVGVTQAVENADDSTADKGSQA